jgi:pimeloyl-ACP methyl ester carboxylesterase
MADTVTIQTAQGPINFSYVISTPTNPTAKAIVPCLPTVVFLHPEYTWQPGFQPQFADPKLRRFNLVAIDSRGLGYTTGPLSPGFGPIQASEDIAKVLDALQISKVHFFGLSTGTLTAVHFAMKYPLRCLSCFLVSPLSMKEPSDVFEGRTQVADCLLEGFKQLQSRQELLHDSCWGALQLALTNQPNSVMHAFVLLRAQHSECVITCLLEHVNTRCK